MFAIILRGLFFGDEGKGTTVDFLARELDIRSVVRDNGGPQASHHVVGADGRRFAFSQFGSATIIPGARTYLSAGMLIKPENLLKENAVLKKKGIADAIERLRIDPDCAIVTPLHQMVGQMLEVSRGKKRYGSVGMGVGQAVLDQKNTGGQRLKLAMFADTELLAKTIQDHFLSKFGQAQEIMARDMHNRELADLYERYRDWATEKKLFDLYTCFIEQFGYLLKGPEDFFKGLDEEAVIFEGAQGALLDPDRGFWPYVTKTDTTADAAERFIQKYLPNTRTIKIGVLRSYATRHGYGPLVTESRHLSRNIGNPFERENPWQGKFRIGWFDLLAARYGIAINGGVDGLAITNLDRLSELKRIFVCTAYSYHGREENLLDEFFEFQRRRDGSFILETFKRPKARKENAVLSRLLFGCKPAGYRVFAGWRRNISHVKKFENLPLEARNYLRFLESADGLNIPISVISVGEKRDQKFFNNPLR